MKLRISSVEVPVQPLNSANPKIHLNYPLQILDWLYNRGVSARASVWLCLFFATTQCILTMLASFIPPKVKPQFHPPLASVTSMTPDVKDPVLGFQIPHEIVALGQPTVLIVHDQCIGCVGESLLETVRMAFREPGAVNLVLAESQDTYRQIAATTVGAKVIYGRPALARTIGLRFSPRVYGIDAKGRLVFIQNNPASSIRRSVDECTAKLKG